MSAPARMRVPLLDVAGSNTGVTESVLRSFEALARAGRFILGPAVLDFEREAAEYLRVRAAIGVASGSDALVCALLALGIGTGDEVVTTPFSFFASVESILRVGARPRFADIRPDTCGLDFDAVASVAGSSTRAIVLVHLYGQPAEIRSSNGLPVIEDAAQAFGAKSGGKRVGGLATAGCFSFQPTKPLGAWGDAGLIATNDLELAERCRRLRAHGAASKHRHLEIGGNYRMDALQAVVLSEKLPKLDEALQRRREHAEYYEQALAGFSEIQTPSVVPGTESSRALYTIRVRSGQRDALRDFLAERGVETAVHYPIALHRQPALLDRGLGAPEGAFIEAERAAREVLALPLFPGLSEEQRAYVAGAIHEFFGVGRTNTGTLF